MPWRDAMSAREALMWDINGGMSVTLAAEVHGVTRSCAYKWVGRYRRYGVAGLEELSRKPEHSPTRTSGTWVSELVKLKRKHPLFGPAKLTAMLEERHGEPIMAVSTAGEILARHGLVRRRQSRGCLGSIERGPFEVAGAGFDDHRLQRALPDGEQSVLLSADDRVLDVLG
jgi:transposase